MAGSPRRSMVLALLLGACKGDAYTVTEEDASAYAEARCAPALACCETPPFDPCVETVRDSLLHYQDLTDSPLSFSGDCMREALEWFEQTNEDLCDPLVHSRQCELAHGDREEGEPCIDFGDIGFYGHDCASGMACLSDRCGSNDPIFLQEAPIGGSCDLPGWKCGDGAYCAADGTCQLGAGPGEPCMHPFQCEPSMDYYCAGLESGTAVCTLRPLLGEPCIESEDACHRDTSEGAGAARLRCADGVCQHYPPDVCEDLDGDA